MQLCVSLGALLWSFWQTILDSPLMNCALQSWTSSITRCVTPFAARGHCCKSHTECCKLAIAAEGHTASCFVHLQVMETLAFFLDIGADLGSFFNFDFVAEGELQLGNKPALCSFVRNTVQPSDADWCAALHTHGCCWSPGDSNLDFILRLQAIGLVSKSWSWPIFTKPDCTGCLPAVPTKGPTPPPPPPPRITSISISFCIGPDGKVSHTRLQMLHVPHIVRRFLHT